MLSVRTAELALVVLSALSWQESPPRAGECTLIFNYSLARGRSGRYKRFLQGKVAAPPLFGGRTPSVEGSLKGSP